MSRPLMQLGVGELEALFAKSKTDIKALKQLEHELLFRQVPRAVALLAEVRTAMGAPTSTSPRVSSALPAPPSSEPRESKTSSTSNLVAPIDRAARSESGDKASEPPILAKPPRPAAPSMSLEDAYKLLKATASSTWESIEQTRRKAVQESSPLRTAQMSQEKRSQLLAEARRINAACATVYIRRTE